MIQNTNMILWNKIWDVNDSNFNDLAIEMFHFQVQNNALYCHFLEKINIKPNSVYHWLEIPCLPIQFFKHHQIKAFEEKAEIIFSSSSTSGMGQSFHHIKEEALYIQSYQKSIAFALPDYKDYAFLFLLPSYAQRQGSSLIYMANDIINSHPIPCGFYLDQFQDLSNQIIHNQTHGIKTYLFGVSYALLDFADFHGSIGNDIIIIETGGMKGKRKEMLKHDMYDILKSKFNTDQIFSEYGMTELMSQCYSKINGIYSCPPWMKVSSRQINDPLSKAQLEGRGALNIIDLCNLYSCPFLATDDWSYVHSENSFEILGRTDHSDLRGCNLMY